MYARKIKRVLDFSLSFLAIIALSPVFLILIILGTINMKGNPFFFQARPGKDEKIFMLIKFRSMTNEKDKDGNLLPNAKRLTKYGKILRSTSLDELPELINIFIGNMSIVGPRPLSVKYLPYYTEEEKHRHDVKPGLTGLAQINGRNALSWEEKFAYDIKYIENITFLGDLKIILKTVHSVFLRENIDHGKETPQSLHILRQEKQRKEVTK